MEERNGTRRGNSRQGEKDHEKTHFTAVRPQSHTIEVEERAAVGKQGGAESQYISQKPCVFTYVVNSI